MSGSDTVKRMRESRPELFRGRHFRDEMIVLCVRWYLRFPLSYRDLEEMMAERGITVDHSTIAPLGSPLRTDSERAYPARDAESEPVVARGRNLYSRCRPVDLF